MTSPKRLGLAVMGFGWMGQAHTRSYLRLPTLFDNRAYDAGLVICSDNVESRRHAATSAFGFREATDPHIRRTNLKGSRQILHG